MSGSMLDILMLRSVRCLHILQLCVWWGLGIFRWLVLGHWALGWVIDLCSWYSQGVSMWYSSQSILLVCVWVHLRCSSLCCKFSLYEFIDSFVHFLNVGFREWDLIICICDYWFDDRVEYVNFLLSGGWECHKGLALFVCFVVSVSHFFWPWPGWSGLFSIIGGFHPTFGD